MEGGECLIVRKVVLLQTTKAFNVCKNEDLATVCLHASALTVPRPSPITQTIRSIKQRHLPRARTDAEGMALWERARDT